MKIMVCIEKHRGTIKQAILFLGVGLATLLLDVFVTNTMYSILHVPAAFASAVGFLSGFLFNFPMNRKKVFHHADDDRFSLQAQIIQYATLSVFNLIATSLAVGFLTDSGIVAIQYAKTIVTAVFAVWNFALFKLVIFSKQRSAIT